MNRYRISDEKTRVIFTSSAFSYFRDDLDGSEQKPVLKKLADVAENPTSPESLVYEEIGDLDIFAVGNQIRLYTKVVENIPRQNTRYHLIYVFHIDEEHDYDDADLITYSRSARRAVERATSLEGIEDVEEYLDEMDALSPEDLRDLL